MARDSFPEGERMAVTDTERFLNALYENAGDVFIGVSYLRGNGAVFFILHRAILVSSDMRYARKVKSGFIVSTISR